MNQPVEQLKKSESNTAQDDFEIYIIDDDPAFSFMLKDYILSAMEMESKHITNGTEFLKKYKTNDSRKIILDYEFSEGPNGLLVLQKIKELNPTAVVIVVSGQDDLEKAIDTLRNGATDYFLKTNKTVFANIHCSLKKIIEMEKNKWN